MKPEPTTEAVAGGAMPRRSFLGCALAYGVVGPILVACSSDSGSGSEGGEGGSGTSAPAAGAALVAVADVPVGGGVALTDKQIVVTQPSKGEFKAFTAVCTHQGTIIDKVEDGDMVCPNHGSRFAIEDGSVDQGPAAQPLAEVSIKVEGDQVVAA